MKKKSSGRIALVEEQLHFNQGTTFRNYMTPHAKYVAHGPHIQKEDRTSRHVVYANVEILVLIVEMYVRAVLGLSHGTIHDWLLVELPRSDYACRHRKNLCSITGWLAGSLVTSLRLIDVGATSSCCNHCLSSSCR